MTSKHVVIIGASRGIGFETAKLFANNGHHVYAFSRNIEPLINLNSPNLHAFQLDLEKAAYIETTVQKALSNIDQIDYLINNAGKLINKPFLELTNAEVLSSYQVNVLGVFSVCRAIIPKIIQKGGHIVNISSMGAFQGSMKFAGLSSYSSAKAALCNLSEMLAEEYKEMNIKSNALCLGAVQTEMLEEAFPGYKAPVSPNEMAEFIVDFTSNAHRFINGKIIPVSISTP